jgi:hypothetical protein
MSFRQCQHTEYSNECARGHDELAAEREHGRELLLHYFGFHQLWNADRVLPDRLLETVFTDSA